MQKNTHFFKKTQIIRDTQTENTLVFFFIINLLKILVIVLQSTRDLETPKNK